MIVYAAAWDGAQKPELFSVRAESPESLRLALPARQVESISRSGEMLLLDILHFSTAGTGETGTLSQTPLSGSAPRELLEDAGAADWSPDGSALAVVRAPNWRYRLEFPVGKVLYETTGWVSHPRVSPRGDSVAFLDHPVSSDDLGSVAIMDRSGKKRILSAGWGSVQGLAWSASGEEIWFTAARTGARALYAVSLSGRQRTLATAPGGMMLQDVSRDGRALFIRGSAQLGILGLVPGETKERDLSGLEWSSGPLLSEDAKTLAFTEWGEGAGATGSSVYMRKLDGSPAVRLGAGQALAISPDGKWILICVMGSTPSPIVLLPTRTGEPRSFPKDAIDHAGFEFAAFLPDGKNIIVTGREPGRPPRVFVQDLAGGAARPVTPEGVVASLLSPDGKTLLIRTEQGFALTPLEGGPSRAVPGLDREDRPLRWASDGRGFFVGHGRSGVQLPVFLVDTETGRREVWKEFRPADLGGITDIGPWAISADGETILFLYTRILTDLYLAEGLK
jgi:Tol biopolymer transport system component